MIDAAASLASGPPNLPFTTSPSIPAFCPSHLTRDEVWALEDYPVLSLPPFTGRSRPWPFQTHTQTHHSSEPVQPPAAGSCSSAGSHARFGFSRLWEKGVGFLVGAVPQVACLGATAPTVMEAIEGRSKALGCAPSESSQPMRVQPHTEALTEA